jgi:hypothetical protein
MSSVEMRFRTLQRRSYHGAGGPLYQKWSGFRLKMEERPSYDSIEVLGDPLVSVPATGLAQGAKRQLQQ